MFKMHGMDYHRTPLGTSTAPYRDVWRVGTVQRKCCSGSLRESKCLAGVRAALAGQACEVDGDGICGTDSYKASTVASFERAGRYGRSRRDSHEPDAKDELLAREKKRAVSDQVPTQVLLVGLEHPHTVPADGAVGVEVEGHQVFWTCDNKPLILVLTTMPPHTDSSVVSTKTKAGLVTEDDPLPF
ncbi:hypothetical protein NFI96_001771 [Prochilodus magdalenae]|nr:hypothetical protein NFI96_001771 [Prochilodus magdalenae]